MILSPYDSPGPRPEPTLFAVLAGAARRRRDGELAIWAAGGVILAAGIAVTLPGRWLPVLIGICTSAFGLWGIVDRELAESCSGGEEPSGATTPRAGRARTLRVVRGTIAVIGIAAGALLLLGAFAAALGTWIS
ncbi:MAG TPA: hypothetical protein VMM18_03915 [Gemmatimonadaceae bacterium]|nr:hypothetical protein [Gemmatimonadaceae bacterium]